MTLPLCITAAAVAAVLALPPAPGQTGALRYRDAVFAEVAGSGLLPFRQAANVTGSLETLTLDVYDPAGDPESRRPAIVWIHGGGFRPRNNKRQKSIVTMANEFAKPGYAPVAPDDRVRREIGSGLPPAIIAHGTADELVRSSQSEQLAATRPWCGGRRGAAPFPGSLA